MEIIPTIGLDPFLFDFLEKLILSLMIGIIIGIEREHRRAEHPVFAGVRTYSLAAVTGMLATIAGKTIGNDIIVAAAFLIIACSIALIYRTYTMRGKLGMTSALSLFCTFLLGILVANGNYLFAIAGGVAITFLTIEKRPLHSFAQNLSNEDILNSLQFLAVAFILYPLVPDEELWGIVDLKATILIVVLVMFIGFISYISLKRFGAGGGIPYSGLLGGFVSSEATTAALASIAKEKSGLVNAFYIGILLSNLSMFISNLLIALIVDNSGKTTLNMLPPQLLMILVVIGIFWKNKNISKKMEGTLDIGSPFALKPALRFGAIFLVLQIFATFANEYAGTYGTYVTALGGVASSSAVTASMASLAVKGEISYMLAAETAVIAGIVSTLNKITYIRIAGALELEKRARMTLILLSIVGIVGLIVWIYADIKPVF